MAVKTYQDSKDKYLKEKVDTFVLRVPKGKKDEIAEYAASLGMSLNGYITSLVFADMGVETDISKKTPAPKAKTTAGSLVSLQIPQRKRTFDQQQAQSSFYRTDWRQAAFRAKA